MSILGGNKTGVTARARLSNCLKEDRTHLTNRELSLIRLDVLAALSDYVEMERDKMTVSLVHGEGKELNSLTITVPILSKKGSAQK